MADFEMPRVRLGIHGFEIPRMSRRGPMVAHQHSSQIGLLLIETRALNLFCTLRSQNWVMAVWGLVELTILVSDEDGIAIIKYAFSKGITFFDTSDIYGVEHSNEILVGKMGELKKLMEESKIKYIDLSEASPNTIRRAHAVHPITALQMKYYLLTRDIEEEIIPLCRCFILLQNSARIFILRFFLFLFFSSTGEVHQEYIDKKGQESSS